jgi:hypothetical protein
MRESPDLSQAGRFFIKKSGAYSEYVSNFL